MLASCMLALGTDLAIARPTGERIVGGNNADIKDFSHQLSLEVFFMHSCGASVINEDFALTAAHCVQGMPREPPWFVRLRAGSTSGFLGIGGIMHAIEYVEHHPEWNKSSTDFDIGLIKVQKPFEFSNRISPIKLVDANAIIKVGTLVTVSGWGMTSERALFAPFVLHSVTVPVVDREACNHNYTLHGGNKISKRMICAGGTGDGKDSCQGDSGGPLISQDRRLIGVVSWGYGCGRSGFPGIYTNVANPDIRRWVKEVTGV